MFGDLSNLGPWQGSEYARYEPCAMHAGPLARMDFDDACGRAAECDVCLVDFRTQEVCI